MPSRTLSPTGLPHTVLPMLAVSAAPFDKPGWLFEVKWDGVRAMVSVANRGWRMWGREGQDYTGRYPELAGFKDLPSGTMLDGELVAIRAGRPDFHALMSRHSRRIRRPFLAEPVHYVVFDLLYFRGHCLMDQPLSDRRSLLQDLPQLPFVSSCQGLTGHGKAFFRQALAAGHEGVVAKPLSSRYLPDRRGWRKVKEQLTLPCVVIGYRAGREGLRDLLMATVVNGALTYAGVVELGIPESPAALLRLESSRTSKPVVACPVSARWVTPEIFCTVHFCGWRPAGPWRDPVIARWDE